MRAKAVLAASTAFFALAAAWGLFGPMQAGHWSAMAASAIAGENMVRFHLFAAVTRYTAAIPTPNFYYCHHPYGIFLLEAVSQAIFGHHPAAVRIVAVVCSACSVPLVYALAKELWKRESVAAVAAVTFVVVPVDLCFAGFSSLEVPTILFGLLFSWATAVHWRAPTRRTLILAIVGALGTAQSDWPGVVLVGTVAGVAVLRMLSPWMRWPTEAAARRRLVVWALAVTGMAIATVLLYAALFAKDDRLGDLAFGYTARTGHGLPRLAAVVGARRLMWTSWMLTWPGVAIAAAGFVLSLLRVRDHPAELLPLAWTLTATVQYLVFPAGANVHIFWPQYYGVCIALGMGVLLSRILDARLGWIERSTAGRRARTVRLSRWLVAVAAGLPVILLARVALPELRQARLTSGRFDEAGHPIKNDADAALFAEWAARDLDADAVVLRPSSFPMDPHLEYSAHHTTRTAPVVVEASPPTAVDRILVLDSRRASPVDLRAMASAFDVQAVGPFWRVDRSGHGIFEAKRYTQGEPGFFESYFVTGPDLERSIGADDDPWATWQWRDHLGLAGTAPTDPPETLEQVCIAHNAAMASGDVERSAALRGRAIDAVGDAPTADFPNDLHLLAVAVSGESVRIATLLWEVGDHPILPESPSSLFSIRCTVTKRPVLWPAAVDFYEKTLASPEGLPPSLWKPRYLYVERFVLQPRIGREACLGSFGTTGLSVALFTLP